MDGLEREVAQLRREVSSLTSNVRGLDRTLEEGILTVANVLGGILVVILLGILVAVITIIAILK